MLEIHQGPAREYIYFIFPSVWTLYLSEDDMIFFLIIGVS